MITHFAELKLNTVSKEGVKQVYHGSLQFPICYETETEIRFQPTEQFTLTFMEVCKPVSPAHFAFEIAYSSFESSMDWIRKNGVSALTWPDGSETEESNGVSKSIYFRDGDGNLVEMIAHSYINEKALITSGPLSILYLREVGLPTSQVVQFREWLKSTLFMKTNNETDTFNFVIGGTAHVIVTSTERKWIPISMYALKPTVQVTLGASSIQFLDELYEILGEQKAEGLSKQTEDKVHEIYFDKEGYCFCVKLTNYDPELLLLLNLP